VVESPIFFVMLPEERWILAGAVVLRTLLLLALLLEFVGQIWPVEQRQQQLRRVGALASWLVMALTLVGLVAGAPRATQAYGERRLAEHPCRDAIVYLRDQAAWPNATVVSDQIEIWRDLSPWLADHYAMRIVDGYDPANPDWDAVLAARLDRYVGHAEFWWVIDQTQPSHADDYFAQPDVQIIDQQTLGHCLVRRVMRPTTATLATMTVAGGPIRLRSVATARAKVGEALAVVLYWESVSPVTKSYTVFTHLVDAAGQIVAQQDNVPVTGLAPTNTWQTGVLIRDPYRLPLPPTLVPGDYQLLVGLYSGESRQPVTLADGSTADQVAISVTINE